MAASVTFKKVRHADAADELAFRLYLYKNEDGRVCGWFLGPIGLKPDGVHLPYLPRSKDTRAPVAVVRALEAAQASRSQLCVVDPDDLWEPAWRVGR